MGIIIKKVHKIKEQMKINKKIKLFIMFYYL